MDKNKIVFQQQEEVAFNQLKEQIQDVKFYNSQFYRNYSWDKSALSVECYCTITGTSYSSYSWQYPFSIGSGAGIGFEYLKGISNNYYTVRIYILGTGKDFASPYFNLGSYSHVVVSYDGAGTANVYINGALVGSVSGSNDKDLSNSFLSVGSSQITPTNQLNGNVRILRVFNHALSASEVTQLYNNGKPEEYVLPLWYKNQTNKVFITKDNFTLLNWGGGLGVENLIRTTTDISFDLVVDPNRTHAGIYASIAKPNALPYSNYDVTIELDESTPYTKGYIRFFTFSGSNAVELKSDDRIHFYTTANTNGYPLSPSVCLMFYSYANQHIIIKSITFKAVGCIAEYLPQNLITAHDGQMSDITPVQWLDSAKQLPINDQYLPPLRGSIGEYDLTANGTPEIVQKPILTRVINVKFTTDYDDVRVTFDSTQTDATLSIVDNIAYCNCGTTSLSNRPSVIGYGNWAKFIVGKKYRLTAKWTLIRGNVGLTAYGNWQTDAYQVVQSTYDTEIKQYSWDSGIIPYDQAASTYNKPFLYFGNSVPNSEFSIDEMTIYEYN